MDNLKQFKSPIEKFYENILKPEITVLSKAFSPKTDFFTGELSDKIFEIVVKYAEKAYEDYRFAAVYSDCDCSYMEAKIKSVAMCLEINKLLGVKMSDDDVTELVLMFLFRVNEPADDYEEKHKYLDKFLPFGNFYPVSDIMYALVIIAFLVYEKYLLDFQNEGVTFGFDADNFCSFIGESDMLSEESVYVMIDYMVQFHRETIATKGDEV